MTKPILYRKDRTLKESDYDWERSGKKGDSILDLSNRRQAPGDLNDYYSLFLPTGTSTRARHPGSSNIFQNNVGTLVFDTSQRATLSSNLQNDRS
ncbi:hypothetical protein TNIN_249531 [Trichonephila inaurata madagascariensis]|uniref:Uncharacterized protein n=1 Tax=Trichonephila inaurata madagascariensis TaxID=2747483 RepID=A0A8X6Y1X8_9ARAC|nr:hypothetical protein TNIN_249531 [Trichonephila inaurata madagascariensis]